MSKKNRSSWLAAISVACLLAFGPLPVFAEKADRDKPITINADRATEDNKKQEAVFEGNVVLTQGSLRIDANKIIVGHDKEGYDHATAIGNPARFHQKRDGLNEFVDGQAQRIEYDGKQELVQFFDKAQVKRGQDEITGNYIQYNSQTEVFQASSPGQKEGAPTAEGGRVKAVIQPRNRGGPAAVPSPSDQPAKPQ